MEPLAEGRANHFISFRGHLWLPGSISEGDKLKYLALAGCGVVAVVFGASSAAAQVTADGMVAGAPTRSTRIEASVRAEHDSNVARSSPQAAALLGITPEDNTYSPKLDLDIVNPIGRQAVFLQGSVGYQFHDRNRQLDSANANLVGGVGARLGRCGGVASAQYFRGRSEIEQSVAIANVKNILEVKGANFSMNCSTPAGLGVVLSGGYAEGDNSLAQVAVSNYRSTTVSGGLAYGRPQSSIQLLANYTKTETPNTLVPTIGSDGYEQKGIGIHVTRRVGGRIQLDATVDYSSVDFLTPDNAILPPGPVSKASNGLTYSSAIDFRASSRLQLHGSFNRQIKPSLLVGSSYDIVSNYTARLDYKIGSRFNVEFGGEDVKEAGQGVSAALSGLTLTDSEVKAIFGSVRYQQSKRISLVLDARHERRTANLPQFEYSSDRIGLGLAVTY